MKTMTKMMIAVAMMSSGVSALSASEMDGKQLFTNKCAVCHSMSEPADESKVVAPPARGIMFHMGEALDSNEKIKAHIEDFVLEPSKEKAICKSVKRFGVMPSQKGAVSKKELSVIADWMVENLKMDKGEHQEMERGHQGEGKGKGKHRGEGRGKHKGQGKGQGKKAGCDHSDKGQGCGQGKGQGEGKHNGRGKGKCQN